MKHRKMSNTLKLLLSIKYHLPVSIGMTPEEDICVRNTAAVHKVHKICTKCSFIKHKSENAHQEHRLRLAPPQH